MNECYYNNNNNSNSNGEKETQRQATTKLTLTNIYSNVNMTNKLWQIIYQSDMNSRNNGN